MPTYAYRCTKCDHQFEIFHGIKDQRPRRCPRCRGRAKRVPAGGAGLIFKGSGFYITDNRSDSYKERAKAEQTGGAGTGSATPPADRPAKPVPSDRPAKPAPAGGTPGPGSRRGSGARPGPKAAPAGKSSDQSGGGKPTPSSH